MKRFEGRAALVTGAASGIGRATAERFASEGARVLCTDVNEEGIAQTVATIRAAGGEALALQCDVSDPSSVDQAVSTVVAKFGGLHILANVAGIGGFFRTHELAIEQWNKTIAINLTGTFLMIRRSLPHLFETKGAIVNVASVAGVKSHPYAAAYCASKGGVVMLTKALGVEYARKGVRINCVCPGGVETPILNQFQLPPGGSAQQLMRIAPIMDRMARPDEIASSIAFLASDEASYMNGSIVVVDGAMSC